MSLSFYNRYLSDQIHSVADLLEIEGANGQSVPYLGYVKVTLQFPEEFIVTQPEIETLALIVPDFRSNSLTPLLIGTNTLDPLYEQFCEDNPFPNGAYCGYYQVLRTLRIRHKQSQDDRLGLVNLRNSEPSVVPAGEKIVLEGYANIDNVNNEKCVLLEQPTESSLPGGIFVECCLINVPRDSPYKIPVVVRNKTDRDICLPVRCIIGELCAFKEIVPTQNTASCSSQQQQPSQTNNQPSSQLNFDFGESLPDEWKFHMIDKLNTFSDIFSHHDLDYGHATKVKHSIKLKDETPFKQRPRPIHPQDYDAVRRHLQSLLEAGIIRESQSPYASPIVVVKKKNGDVTLCVDYRRLNMQTVKDAYALPNLEESLR